MNNQIDEAIEILKKGGIIIYPTDTAFGIGCRIDNAAAVKKLFSIRQRPLNKPSPVLFDTIKRVENYVQAISPEARDLMNKYWPGALTLVLPAITLNVNSLVLGEDLSIGCRIPDHDVPLQLIKGLGVPIIGTSANFSGKLTPYRVEDLDPALTSLVDMVIPGFTNGQKESTVINCTQYPFTVLRQGAISIGNIES
ncbi:hypothetical protein BH09PAT1_BH09PAT1_8190 [soil metagenome]